MLCLLLSQLLLRPGKVSLAGITMQQNQSKADATLDRFQTFQRQRQPERGRKQGAGGGGGEGPLWRPGLYPRPAAHSRGPFPRHTSSHPAGLCGFVARTRPACRRQYSNKGSACSSQTVHGLSSPTLLPGSRLSLQLLSSTAQTYTKQPPTAMSLLRDRS